MEHINGISYEISYQRYPYHSFEESFGSDQGRNSFMIKWTMRWRVGYILQLSYPKYTAYAISMFYWLPYITYIYLLRF